MFLASDLSRRFEWRSTLRAQFHQHFMNSFFVQWCSTTVWLCNFLTNNIDTKTACKKSLVKLTKSVNFTNTFWTALLYKSFFQSFSLLIGWLCDFLTKIIGTKSACKKVWWNWLKVSISSTFYQLLFHTKILC